MRVTSMVPNMEYAMQQSQQALNTALQQVSTGQRVNQPSDDPAAAATMVISLAASANVDQYTSNVNSMLPQMQTADSAISSVVTSLNTVVTLGTEGATGTSSATDRQAIASQVQGVLASVISQANTEYEGTYVFGGSASSTPPFVAASTTYTSANGSAGSPLSTTTALTPGSVTTISDATTGETFVYKATAGDTIGSLATAIANAATAGTLSAGTTATINSSGQLAIRTNSSTAGIVVSSNDSALGAMTAVPASAVANSYAYVGNSNVNEVQIGGSMNVASNLPGNQLFLSGPNVIGSLNNLITALQSGTSAQISTAANGITTALNYVNQQRVPLDNTISQLNSQDSYLSQETVTLSSQQTSLIGINMADAATNLTQAETQNDAVLASAAKVLPQSLLNYLEPPTA